MFLVIVGVFLFCSLVCFLISINSGSDIRGGLKFSFYGFLLGPISVWMLLNKTETKTISLEGRIDYFYNNKLLANEFDSDSKKTIRTLTKLYKKDWGDELDENDPHIDLIILKYISKLVWWEDTEADVINGNDVYVLALSEWKEITNQQFSPINIIEKWATERGDISVHFEMNGDDYKIHPRYLDDYLDIKVLTEINKLSIFNESQFEVYQPFDQTAFVIFLTKNQKKSLKTFGWKFLW